ncbi:hypothetical protein B6U98_02020 [Thermoplasmatales archaeon ex4572_165]|nr:MAG: hypothetical protein B6U98_02020 [Thermoplasmatales archaeon ex4572_165]
MGEDSIENALDDLLKLDEILACMVARQNMISVMPTAGTEGFKQEIYETWDIIHSAMDDVFTVIREYSPAGLTEMEFNLQNYEALFYVFPDTENALVAIIPALSNKGLISVEMENARRSIIKILDGNEMEQAVTN